MCVYPDILLSDFSQRADAAKLKTEMATRLWNGTKGKKKKKKKNDSVVTTNQFDRMSRSIEDRKQTNRKRKNRKDERRSGKRSRPEKSSEDGDNLSALQRKFKQKLQGAQFRWINEELYTKESSKAFEDISKEKFDVYHRGFTEQVRKWPVNPVRVVSAFLRGRKEKKLVVADFGCGDAKLSECVGDRHVVHSFDLVAANDRVTACDMAHVPLPSGSVDVGVFCLSLMGTNLRDFIAEAFRVLKPGAELIVAEVKSRFEVVPSSTESNDEKATSGIQRFVLAMRGMHFKLLQKNEDNKMFALFRFRRTRSKTKRPSEIFNWAFKPCVYKKR